MNRTYACRIVGLVALAASCSTPDFDVARVPSYAISPSTDTRVKRQFAEWSAENDGPSGFFPLSGGSDALGARLRFMGAAEQTIDAQYFLMKSDAAGYVFAAGLLAAADRGVRVRLLLDDIFTSIRDEEVALIDAHPNVELRLFNPISRNGVSGVNFLSDFKRANRRMHNKSFIVDNQAAIVGGRNIADEYFALLDTGEFLDFDVIALGPIAADVSREFDEYWNHSRSLPAASVVRRFDEAELARFRERLNDDYLDEAREIYREAVNSDLMLQFDRNSERLFSADAVVLTDEPDKLVDEATADDLVVIRELAEICRGARSEIVILSPYFVPGDDGVAFWREQVERGVRVVVITNSLASNNHTAVHSGYASYRKDLLRAGVELYEVRANAADDEERSTTLTLHTKALLFDRERLFVGSLNLDPRSIDINSEMGLVIDSAQMTGQIADGLFDSLDAWTYRIEFDDDGDLQWRATIAGQAFVTDTEPLTSCWRRCVAWFLKIVPDRQL